jgi:hypothetical protein
LREPSAYHASDGAAYRGFIGRWTAALAPVFLDFVRIPEAGDVLDLACGTGSLAAEIARRKTRSFVQRALRWELYDGTAG